MTRKHFNAIASAIAEEVGNAKNFPGNRDRNDAALDHLENLASRLCATFQQANPAFDKARFMAACGF